MKYFITLFFISMFINAQGQLIDHSGWKTYFDNEFFFSFSYPPNWEFHDDVKNTKCMIFAPSYEGKKFSAQIGMTAFELPPSSQNTNIKDFAETSFGQLRKMMKDCRVMVAKDVSEDGIQKFLVVANGLLNGKYVYVKQLYSIYNHVAYIIDYTGEAGIKDPYAIIAGDILNSLKPQKMTRQ